MATKRCSPLRYPGGKGKMYNHIKNIIIKNNLLGCSYCEVFAGGAEVALRLLVEGIVSRIIINDLDFRIYSFWYSIFNFTDEFLDMIDKKEITLEERLIQKKINKTCDDKKILEVGFSTFYLNRVNRSGVISAGPISSKKNSEKYSLGCRYNKEELKGRIKKISQYRDKIEVSGKDANILLEELKERTDDLFLFIDPPYYTQGKKIYLNYFNEYDHIKLHDKINQIAFRNNIKYIVTYDDVDEINEIYSDYVPEKYYLTYTLEKKTKGKEVLFYSANLRIQDIFV